MSNELLRPPAGATGALARALIERRSVTPADEGCQALLIDRLAALGFNCETLHSRGVDNVWARRGSGRAGGL